MGARIRRVAGSIPARGYTDLYCASGVHGNCPVKGGGNGQMDQPPLIPLSVAGCGRLLLEVGHGLFQWHYCKQLLIDPTNSGSIFSSGGRLAIEDFTQVYKSAECRSSYLNHH